jgi:hypothetical protein
MEDITLKQDEINTLIDFVKPLIENLKVGSDIGDAATKSFSFLEDTRFHKGVFGC